MNSQSCKRLLNNFSGMPEAPIITGYDIYYSFEYVRFNISVQPNIKPDKITIYYYNQVIKDITITGSNGEFVVTFKHILNLGTYNIQHMYK